MPPEQTATEAQIAMEQLEALLDKNLDDIDDLPEYLEQCPTGFYKLHVQKVEFKSVEITPKGQTQKIQAPAVQFTYAILEVLELKDAEKVAPEDIPKAGSLFNESIFFHSDPKKATEVIKAKFEEIGIALGIDNALALVKKLEGLAIAGAVKTKKDKNKEDTYYIQVSNCKLV